MAEKDKDKSKKSKQQSSVVLFLRDAGIALLFVVLVLLAMYAYTGLWPPLVVVESNSMMHGDDNLSHIGTIDTGDLVLVKDVSTLSDISTYIDGYASGHRTYEDYGDVVIYKREGSETQTPIIHRAMIYLEANSDGVSYRAPSLQNVPSDKWSTTNPEDTWDHLTSVLLIYHVGWSDSTVAIDVVHFIPFGMSGFITKGDHNPQVDQISARGPVQFDWIVGKARGEIPWFGLLKLWFTDTLGSPAPQNSVQNLWISLAIIVATPIAIDITLTYKEKRDNAKKKAEDEGDGPDDRKERVEGEDPVKTAEGPSKRT